jgi:hypothetical protein
MLVRLSALLSSLPLLYACTGHDDSRRAWANNADISAAGSGRAFVAGYDQDERGFVKELSDGSLTSVFQTDSGPLNGIWADTEGHAIAVGNFGNVATLSDGRWLPSSTGISAELTAVWAAAPDNVFAVGNSGAVARSDGAAWQQEPNVTSSNLRAVWGTSGDDVFAVGTGGTIIHYDGSAWSVMDSGTSEELNGVWGFGPQNVLVVGGSELTDTHVILRYDGARWHTELSGEPFALLGIDGDPATGNIFAVGAARGRGDDITDAMLRFDGTKWSRSEPGIGEFLWDALAIPTGGCYVVGPGNTFAQLK